MSKHSLGEWAAVKPDGSNGYWCVVSQDPMSKEVCTCYGKNAAANAKRIAKAANALSKAEAAHDRR